MATADQILAVLTGTKVYDESTALWRVYDAYGNELVDSSGVVLQGLHGWLLRTAAREELEGILEANSSTVPAGVRKKIAIRFSASAPEVTEERVSAGRVVLPKISVSVRRVAGVIAGRVISRGSVLSPSIPARTTQVGEVCGASFRVVEPFAHGKARFISHRVKLSGSVATPSGWGFSPTVSGSSWALHATELPLGVQNPTAEMLAILW